ncbi:DUF1127 domain-containing protein [Sedimentitalea sp. HM32M-2]|uniref:DUF1127 domain-containing protein n=1 Tax=Sedimentitalea sp. HM32M-2 TaxID=3351566 RepID=UPI003625521E
MTYIANTLNTTRRPTLRNRLSRALALWRQRRALARLDAAALQDIGVTRTAALTEARRPVWDAPANWYR